MYPHNRQIAEFQTLYETEKKDKEISLLNKDKALQDATLKRQKLAILFLINPLLKHLLWLAQLTLAPNSLGSLHLEVSTDEALSPFEYDFAVINGYVVPEPATLSLVAIGSMACLGLRRRSHAP